MEISERSKEIHLNFTLFTFHFSLLILQPIFKENWLQNKTIHPKIELHICALVPFSARGRRPRGTSH